MVEKGIIIAYVIPIVVFGIFCASTPWTHLVMWVDANGVSNEGTPQFDDMTMVILSIKE